MVEITYQMVLSTLQTIALIVGIAYYLFIMRNSQRNQQHQLETRQAQLYMTLFNTINNQNIWRHWNEIREYQFTDYDDFMDKYGPVNNPEAYDKYVKVLWLFTEMGVLVQEGYITVEHVGNLMEYTPIRAWRKFGPIIEKERGKRYSIGGYGTFEYLAKIMMQRIMSEDPILAIEARRNAIPDITISEILKYAKENPELRL